jgi:hypothetical protein
LREHQQTQFREIINEEQRKLRLKHPEIVDPINGHAVQTNIVNYLNSKGFSNEDISKIYDSRYFDVIMDGINFQKTKAAKPSLVSKKVKPSNFVKSGTKSTKEELNSKTRLNQLKALKKSGSPKDATDLLMRYL